MPFLSRDSGLLGPAAYRLAQRCLILDPDGFCSRMSSASLTDASGER
jgi:hypothetical protein